jgi:hypothetical protein
MCATFLPLLYSVVFPNEDLWAVVYALEGRGNAPSEAAAVVQETIAAAGPLKRAVPVAYYSGVTATVRISGSSQTSKKQASYIAWFQEHRKPLLLIITVYEGDGGRRGYEINEGEAVFMVRGYTLPVLLFGVSLFLVRKRKSSRSVTEFHVDHPARR